MRRFKTLAGLTAGMMLLGSAAMADIVYNDLDPETEPLKAEVESIVMEVGDDPETVGLYIRVRNAAAEGTGGESGCNLKGGRELVLDIYNSAPSSASVTADAEYRYEGNAAQVLLKGDCEVAVDGTEIDLLKATLTVQALAPTADGAPANITFGRNSASTALGNTSLVEASFDVTVLAQAVEMPSRDAPAIANEYLKQQSNEYTDNCKAQNGTNKNKNNWHGQLISKVAQEFEGQSFTLAQEDLVTGYVDLLCPAS
jgi:hypothetical protein